MRQKPRGDAKLKTLSPEKQVQIIEWLNTGTKDAAKARIEREFGVHTNGASLTDFYDWWHIPRRLEKADRFTTKSVESLAANPALGLNKKQLAEAGQIIFELKAMEENDTESYVALRKLRQQEELLEVNKGKLELDEKRYQRETCELFLKWYADRKAQEIVGGQGDNKAKLDQLGKLMFGEEWAA